MWLVRGKRRMAGSLLGRFIYMSPSSHTCSPSRGMKDEKFDMMVSGKWGKVKLMEFTVFNHAV